MTPTGRSPSPRSVDRFDLGEVVARAPDAVQPGAEKLAVTVLASMKGTNHQPRPNDRRMRMTNGIGTWMAANHCHDSLRTVTR